MHKKIEIVQCPCGCSTYHLNWGSFYQGCEWDKEDAQFVADAINEKRERELLHTNPKPVQVEGQVKPIPGPIHMHGTWDVTGYPVFSIHGISGQEKDDLPVLENTGTLLCAAYNSYQANYPDDPVAVADELGRVKAERDELLEALKSVLGWAEGSCDLCGLRHMPESAHDRAYAVAAKVEGRL